MRKLLLILALMSFVMAGCGGIQLKGDVKKLIIDEIAWEVGYFTAKKYPEIAKDLEKAAALVKDSPTEGDLNKWLASAIEQLVEDPVLANRFKKLSQLIQIDISAIENPMERSKRIGQILTEFSAGSLAGLGK